MTRVELDAGAWRTRADFFAAFLPVLGVPQWVGGNLDALFDALGGHCRLRPPFEVMVSNSERMPAAELAYIHRAEQVFADARATFGQEVFLRFV